MMLLHNIVQAYHSGKYYPNYAWILLGHHETDWWREHYMETNCSDTDMMKVLNRSLILIPYPEFYNSIKVYTCNCIQNCKLYLIICFLSLWQQKALPWLWPVPCRAMNMTGHGMEHMKDHQTPMWVFGWS